MTGMFMRHFMGQQPGESGGGWSDSPDIIPYGTTAATDPTVFTTSQGYGQDFGKDVTFNQQNFVYLRALNTTGGAQTSRVYLYFLESDLCLWPTNWRSDSLMFGGKAQNWIDLSATAQNQIVDSIVPLEWNVPSFHSGASSGDHYCLTAWVDDSPNPQPPDLASFGYMGSVDQLAQFIIAHPNMAWRNTTDVTAPAPTQQFVVPITNGNGWSQMNVGVQFSNIPTDGFYSLSVPGPDANDTIAIAKSPIQSPNGGFSQLVNYPPNFQTSVTINYWQGATVPPVGAKVSAVIIKIMSDTDRMLSHAIYKLTGRRTRMAKSLVYNPQLGVFDSQMEGMIVGQQPWSLNYGGS